MNKIYILLGANLGDPIAQLAKASVLLKDKIGPVITQSSVYESQGWGVEDQPLFYNQALIIQTNLDKHECLRVCQEIEIELGRVRLVKWGARLIDIDIIYFNEEVYESENLRIPHPLLQFRNFVLIPLCEIAENYLHPVLLKTTGQLLATSKDKLPVHRVKQ
ncbi:MULTISPECIES: 2-amino-4-hydroxy-6-hydroxymethyldihydropteridine diphosphokinase [Sphingobacterium]|uniref:2-amino-4-hydroxy-6- hydroxymethyldihydropteridine diphosphokinase n=1 Tax=Sphingobacterium TaxID=28453 RepID=UPI0013DA9982|nr:MULTISPECIES: 2-amino-4-hydroxy-6-hydroxymethyldihydropteridine diphosphokinase [unclassified Sphingobacterium]